MLILFFNIKNIFFWVYCNQVLKEKKGTLEKKVRLAKKEKQDLKAHKEKLALLDPLEKAVLQDLKDQKEIKEFPVLKVNQEKLVLLDPQLMVQAVFLQFLQACTYLSQRHNMNQLVPMDRLSLRTGIDPQTIRKSISLLRTSLKKSGHNNGGECLQLPAFFLR